MPPRGAFFHDGRPGVVFTIRKRADARLFDLRENLQTLVTDLRETYPRLHFQLDNDQTAVLRASIDNLQGGLLYGAGFAILVLFAFFRQWRRPLLIGLAVPIALLIAVIGFYLAGLSINVISLAGLILGLGLMIDNSIIVLDNIASLSSEAKSGERPPNRISHILRCGSNGGGHPPPHFQRPYHRGRISAVGFSERGRRCIVSGPGSGRHAGLGCFPAGGVLRFADVESLD